MIDNKQINQDMLRQAIKLGDMDLFNYMLEKEPIMADERFSGGSITSNNGTLNSGS